MGISRRTIVAWWVMALMAVALVSVSCRRDEPDEEGLFHLTLAMEAPADVAMGLHSADVWINGEAKEIRVTVVGTYETLTVSEQQPDWVALAATDRGFSVSVPVNDTDDARTVRVDFTVAKGRETQRGYVTVTQQPITAADYQKREQKAMKNYLRRFDVVEQVPRPDEIIEGPVAPYYRLDAEGTVYMQVVRKGSAPAATEGERIYFRFNRYDLLRYMADGAMPPPFGNWSDIEPAQTSFVVGSDDEADAMYGKAIQMPLLLGLAADSEVNLVVASSAGFADASATYTPYLYSVRYYLSPL